MKDIQKTKILYVSYDGILEPLGQSQILSYIKEMKNYSIDILSFEKKSDLINCANKDYVENLLEENHITWHKASYTKSPRVLSTIWDLIKGAFVILKLYAFNHYKLVHARGDIAAIMAYPIFKASKVKLVFDMRGFWADERVDWSIWKRKGIIYKVFKRLENILFSESSGIVSLTEVGIKEIERLIGKTPKHFKVIPTCTDLQLFSPIKGSHRSFKTIKICHLGAVETRYEFKKVCEFINNLSKTIDIELTIINKGEHKYIKSILQSSEFSNIKYTLLEAKYSDVGRIISNSNFGIFFPKRGFYLNGYFPTKLGEFLSCGIPVITTAINDDVDNIIRDHRIGITTDLENLPNKDLLFDLMQSKGIEEKCRAVAETKFSAKLGAKNYMDLYEEVIHG